MFVIGGAPPNPLVHDNNNDHVTHGTKKVWHQRKQQYAEKKKQQQQKQQHPAV
jgi:hypothetical protein